MLDLGCKNLWTNLFIHHKVFKTFYKQSTCKSLKPERDEFEPFLHGSQILCKLTTYEILQPKYFHNRDEICGQSRVVSAVQVTLPQVRLGPNDKNASENYGMFWF